MRSLSLVDVSVLVKGLREPSFSFFSTYAPAEGTVVTVPFRNKNKPALVVSVRHAQDSKAEIRQAEFSLKKIPLSQERNIVSRSMREVTATLADLYATSRGEVFLSLFPNKLLDRLDEITETTPNVQGKRSSKDTSVRCIQGNVDTRLEQYVREAETVLARGDSVFILTPTRERCRFISERLTTVLGHEHVFELTSRVSSNKLLMRWNRVAEESGPLVVVGTSAFLSVPLSRPGLYILEGASDSYHGLSRPFLDERHALLRRAEAENVPVLLGSIYIPSDLYEQYVRRSSPKKSETNKILFSNTLDIVDMKPVEEDKQKTPFTMFSHELLEEIERAREKNQNSFLFVARRGLFPSTVCADCSTILQCPQCDAGLVLHESKEKKRFFLCHRCDFTSSADVVCQNCGGWRMTPLGIGVSRVHEEIKERYSNVFIVSHDTTTTTAQARKKIEEFNKTPGAILVGTDMALGHLLPHSVDTAGIISIDARFSVPSHTIEESILNTILTVRSVAARSVVIQTRAREHRVFDAATGIQLDQFRKQELRARKNLGYPPFSTLVSLSYKGRRSRVESVRSTIEEAFNSEAKASVTSFPFRKNARGTFDGTTIVRFPGNLREHSRLRAIVRSLPPEVAVRVDPERLW